MRGRGRGATQDSGNISYGVEVDGRRYFVKTAGVPGEGGAFDYQERCRYLENAVQLHRSLIHPILPELVNVATSPAGPVLVYLWGDGGLLYVPASRRDDLATPFQRFRRLHPGETAAALDEIFQFHLVAAAKGWVAVDFYDGSVLYEFDREKIHLVDVDHYHRGAFVNKWGRMAGSFRFMASEEFLRGATIDERTNVFTMGRVIEQLFPGAPLRGSSCEGPGLSRRSREAISVDERFL